MTNQKKINIEVPVLARVEGEGALELSIADGKIDKLHLRIFEPPRLFEKLLEGRPYSDVPDIVARICGICPVAYQMSAVHAIERIFDIRVSHWIRTMRRLMYCGEWIESHALHIHLLAAPDFLGFDNAIAMAGEYPDEVRRGMKLQGLGNELLRLLGGRSVHPVGVCIGGFYGAPSATAVKSLLTEFRQALPLAEELVRWATKLDVPDDPQQFTSVSLRHANEYPMNEGRIVSNSGLDIAIEEYQQHFQETHVPHSTALHSHLNGQPYLVGPLARVNLNQDKLPEEVLQLLSECGIEFPSNNMFHSVIARAVEIYYAFLEAINIMESYELPSVTYTDISPKAGVGYGCTEAPRGILWHRYDMNDQGDVMQATIVPPTSQNQARIEQDMQTSLVEFGLDQDDEALRQRCETVIRNYDPCISCATHFLKIRVNRQ
ncbi:Ni/Fe hydrogenase subunit alpha [Kaarinaea lacus]